MRISNTKRAPGTSKAICKFDVYKQLQTAPNKGRLESLKDKAKKKKTKANHKSLFLVRHQNGVNKEEKKRKIE